MNVPEITRVQDSLVFTGDVLDIYIPDKNFDVKLAEYNGEYIHAMGIFLFEVKTYEQVEQGKRGRFYAMKLPNVIDFQYVDSFSYKGSINGYPADAYKVFRLENSSKFIANVWIQQDASEVVRFVKALHNGHLPNILTYDEILQMYHRVLAINQISLNAPSIIYELTISEVCRARSNQAKPFREVVTKGDVSLYDYKPVNITKLPILNSTFAGVTFENINDAVFTAIDRTQNGGEEKYSPLEKAIRY